MFVCLSCVSPHVLDIRKYDTENMANVLLLFFCTVDDDDDVGGCCVDGSAFNAYRYIFLYILPTIGGGWVGSLQTMKIKKTIYLFTGYSVYTKWENRCAIRWPATVFLFLSLFELLQISALMACLRFARLSYHTSHNETVQPLTEDSKWVV